NQAWCENVELFFDKRLVRIEDRADQGVVAHFADGSSAEGDFLIGADGVHSVVRTHVVPDGPKPFDTGLIGFGGFVPRSLIEHSGTGQRVQTTLGRTVLTGDAAHATSPQAGQGASLALEDALRLVCLLQSGEELSATFENFERERRPRAERIVALARRNGNHKREFNRTGAWIRDRMLKLMIPLTARRSMDWMYAYNPCAVTTRPETSARRYRQAA